MLPRENFPHASAGNQELRVGCFAEARSPTDERLQFPRAARFRLRREALRARCDADSKEQKRQTNKLHPCLSDLRVLLSSHKLFTISAPTKKEVPACPTYQPNAC